MIQTVPNSRKFTIPMKVTGSCFKMTSSFSGDMVVNGNIQVRAAPTNRKIKFTLLSRTPTSTVKRGFHRTIPIQTKQKI